MWWVLLVFLRQPAREVFRSFIWRNYTIVRKKQRRVQLPEIMVFRKSTEQKLTKIELQD